MGLEKDWLLLLPCTFVHCRMMASFHPCWIGTGGVEADPPRQKLSVTSVGVIFNQWGVKPPNPPDKSNADGHSGPYRTLKITLFRIQDGRRPPSWKIERSPYLSNESTDLDKVWQDYADRVSQVYQLLRIWIFRQSKMVAAIILKNRQIAIYPHRLTDFDEIWRDKAHGHCLRYRTFKIALSKSKMADVAILKNQKIAISLQRIDRSWWNLAEWCRFGLSSISAVENLNFWKSKITAADVLKKR